MPQNSSHSCKTFYSPVSPSPYTLLYPVVFLISLCLVFVFPSFCIRNPSFLFPHKSYPHLLCGQQTIFMVPCSAADSITDNVLEVINFFFYFASTLSSGFVVVCSPSHSLLKHTIVNQDIKLTLQSNQLHFPRFINRNCRTTVDRSFQRKVEVMWRLKQCKEQLELNSSEQSVGRTKRQRAVFH